MPEGSEHPQQTQTGLRYQLENLKTQVESRLSDSNKADTDDQLNLKLEPNTFYRVSNRTEEQIKLYNNANELLETIDGNTAKALDGKRVLKVNQRAFKQLVGENKISYKPLELDQDTD